MKRNNVTKQNNNKLSCGVTQRWSYRTPVLSNVLWEFDRIQANQSQFSRGHPVVLRE